ncbi:unnamed protein product [Zymoseptoria tritici ST99CH_1A5]|uniref:NodB homology domain-containing protein n=2 Tax=Zymoseptoria tritici TaxID=1047171 RepID=A0A2H1H8U0_ZYMTR|nr:unnamed protein product [Zymoseptoria tritici ST99CH_1E4]SMR64678.1 unnamed protein product [Zymoseptoria tritici ST99CH_3D1]SMY30008.1 unnamed protein product [Zymoseptoria tritici ST99CH_1A5]
MTRSKAFAVFTTAVILCICYGTFISFQHYRLWEHGSTSPGMAVGCSSSPKHVALTFDDGPSPHTSKVLKTLAEANVTATFFVAGASDEEYSLVEKTRWLVEIQASGHQVESHTWKHFNLSDAAPKDIEDNVNINEQWMIQTTGHRPRYLRPPFGECDKVCLTTLHRMGYRVVRWNLDPQWSVERQRWVDLYTELEESTNTLWQYPIHEVWSTLGPVVLMHANIPGTAETLLPEVLAFYKKKGYKFVSMTECLGGRQW